MTIDCFTGNQSPSSQAPEVIAELEVPLVTKEKDADEGNVVLDPLDIPGDIWQEEGICQGEKSSSPYSNNVVRKQNSAQPVGPNRDRQLKKLFISKTCLRCCKHSCDEKFSSSYLDDLKEIVSGLKIQQRRHWVSRHCKIVCPSNTRQTKPKKWRKNKYSYFLPLNEKTVQTCRSKFLWVVGLRYHSDKFL